MSTTACSTPGYEYGVGNTRVAVLGSGGLLFSAAAEFLIGEVFAFWLSGKGSCSVLATHSPRRIVELNMAVVEAGGLP